MEKSCDFHKCQSEAVRHFMRRHYCNEHNWYLRVKAQRDEVRDLDSFLSQFQ